MCIAICRSPLLKLGLTLTKKPVKKSFSKEKTGYLTDFLKRYLDFKEPGNLSNLEREIAIITNNNDESMGIRDRILQYTEQQGIETGIKQARIEKSYEFAKNLLVGTNLTIAEIADLVSVSESFVEEIKKTLK